MRKNGIYLLLTGVAVLLFVITWTQNAGAIGGHGTPKSTGSGGNIPPPPKGSGSGDGQGKSGDGGGSGSGGGGGGGGGGSGGQSYPEPSSVILGLVGIGGAALLRRRRNKLAPQAA